MFFCRNHVDFLPEILFKFFTTTHDFSLTFLELVLFYRQFVRSIFDPIYPAVKQQSGASCENQSVIL